MTCTFSYITSKNESEAASSIDTFLKTKFKKIYQAGSAVIVDKNPISYRAHVTFNCHFTDIRKIEKEFYTLIEDNFCKTPCIRFIDEYDTYTIIYEIKNKEIDSKGE